MFKFLKNIEMKYVAQHARIPAGSRAPPQSKCKKGALLQTKLGFSSFETPFFRWLFHGLH
jgi:hypothetical protein